MPATAATNLSTWMWTSDKGLTISDSWFELVNRDRAEIDAMIAALSKRSLSNSQKISIISDWWGKFLHPADRERARQNLDQYIHMGHAGVSDYRSEYRVHVGGGEYANVHSIGHAEWHSNNELKSFVAAQIAFADAAQGKLINEKIKENKALIKAIASSPVLNKKTVAAMFALLTTVSSIISEPAGRVLEKIGGVLRDTTDPAQSVVQETNTPFTPYKGQIAEILKRNINGADLALVGVYQTSPWGEPVGQFVAQARRGNAEYARTEAWEVGTQPEFKGRHQAHVAGEKHEIFVTSDSSMADNFTYQVSVPASFIDGSGREWRYFVAHELKDGYPHEGFDRHLLKSLEEITGLLKSAPRVPPPPASTPTNPPKVQSGIDKNNGRNRQSITGNLP